MVDSGYKRVSRRHPCLICGKPDWCSRTIDESVSFCARITDGADRLSRKERWGVFYHNHALFNQSHKRVGEPKNHFKKGEEIPLAPLEIRDFIYKSLLRLSPATHFESLIFGEKGLCERGLTNYEDYGGLPCSADERKDLAARLRLLFNQNFPSFVRENHKGLAHIPGFWIDKHGEACLWQNRDSKPPLLIIPYRNPAGKIQACQIRFSGKLKPNKKRYLWLSLPKMNSSGSGTPLHFANWKTFGRTKLNQPILITEGALKADVASYFLPRYFTLASGGVGCSHDLVVNVSQGKSIYLAFDNDYQENPAVLRHIARLLKLRFQTNSEQKIQTSTKILAWSRDEKGIDDALMSGEKIYELEIPDWFSTLDKNARMAVQKVWEE
ncbi:MAG: DUF3854 domain-containing protein [Acidobacteria bacterium]|jgi:hypothetical protein|nr:DUF3854 domain-containing protein [Acidobacteriota bacterium]